MAVGCLAPSPGLAHGCLQPATPPPPGWSGGAEGAEVPWVAQVAPDASSCCQGPPVQVPSPSCAANICLMTCMQLVAALAHRAPSLYAGSFTEHPQNCTVAACWVPSYTSCPSIHPLRVCAAHLVGLRGDVLGVIQPPGEPGLCQRLELTPAGRQRPRGKAGCVRGGGGGGGGPKNKGGEVCTQREGRIDTGRGRRDTQSEGKVDTGASHVCCVSYGAPVGVHG
jgi:hypothetical protein